MRTLALFCAALSLLVPRTHAFNSSAVNGNGPTLFWNLTNPPANISTNLVNPSTKAIRFFFASDAYSAANKTNELNAVRASFAQWQSIPGTLVKFEEAGLIAPRTDMIGRFDNTNIVYWVKNTNVVDNGLSSIAGVVGTAYLGFRADGTLIGSDILLNGVEDSWFTDFTSKADPNYFVEAVTIHEIGHALGVDHASIGGATMLASGTTGIDSGAGLSPDEVAFAQATYPKTNVLATLGQLRGQVTKGGIPVFGAAIVVEDATGNLLGSTITHQDGSYRMPALPAGTHKVRVCPLDPSSANYGLIRGLDVSTYAIFDSVDTSFLPTTNTSVTLAAGATNTLNLTVVSADPAFRITIIRAPTTDASSYSISGAPALFYPGQSNWVTGVFSEDLPTNGVSVTITGGGLSLGPPIFDVDLFPGLTGISWTISVASNATPGLRTILISQGTNRAYANGFLEIVSNHPDYNFDGLDDNFQRAYFPLFTAPAAAPNADPDGDGMSNAAEYVAGTVPTNAASLLKVQSVMETISGATVTWQSVAGKTYQLFSRLQLASATWQTAGSPVTATNTAAGYLDATATNGMRFYKVQVLP
jgi:hypothetical protein